MRLITTAVLGAFARVVYANQNRAYRIWIVSPWLQTEEEGNDPLQLLIESLRGCPCSVVLFTRPPELEWHREAIQLIRANTKSIVYFCRHLHTKLYILECDGFRAAILGSPNLTSRAENKNFEIGVEFRTTIESSTDDISALITELTEYASSLRGADGVTLT